MILIFLYFINLISADELFAGNGLQTYAYEILHDRVINVNCTTYDDCYEVLCEYSFLPIYMVTVKPNKWNGNCNSLNMADNRLLSAEFDVGKNQYNTKTISEASVLLCKLNNVTNLIYYFIYDCEFSKH